MNIKTMFSNRGNTVGILKIPDRSELKRLDGYFNKELLKELTELFEVFEKRDMAVYYTRDASSAGASILLLCPNEENDIFLAIAGKTESAQ
jgi:hypothetical protein